VSLWGKFCVSFPIMVCLRWEKVRVHLLCLFRSSFGWVWGVIVRYFNHIHVIVEDL
jgi:hypothetical protein